MTDDPPRPRYAVMLRTKGTLITVTETDDRRSAETLYREVLRESSDDDTIWIERRNV